MKNQAEQRDKARPFIAHPAFGRVAVVLAVVSGLFCLIVSLLLIANYLQIKALDPINQPELLELRQQLAEAPEADPTLIEQIRVMDLLARKAFFTSQAHLRMGGFLLLCGAIVFLIALKLVARCYPRPPAPTEVQDPDQYWNERARTKELLAFAGVVLVIAALAAAYLTPLDVPTSVPAEPGPAVEEATTTAAFPGWEAIQRQWPSFRGPGSYGVAHFDNAPIDWDMATGKNIRWKAEVPLAGFSSPVVWNKHVFLTGATESTREVYCFDGDSGELLWTRAVPAFAGTPQEPPDVSDETGFAAPTMALHGERAYAIFANGDLVSYDFAGELRWGRNLGMPDNHYGHSSSLIAFGKHLFIQYDDKRAPRLIALDAETGKEAWIAQRKKISWASPAYIHTPLGVQLILDGERDVDAYDPESGRLLWTVECLDGEVAPSPAYGGNTVFVANEYAMSTAIRLNVVGTETKPEVAWEYDEYLPEVASPVATDKHIYIATSLGDMACLDIETGESAWTQEFDDGFYSSPMLVGDRIYVLDLEGVMHILGTGAEFKLIGSRPFGEPGFATPAYLDGRIYVRTGKSLICIEEHDES